MSGKDRNEPSMSTNDEQSTSHKTVNIFNQTFKQITTRTMHAGSGNNPGFSRNSVNNQEADSQNQKNASPILTEKELKEKVKKDCRELRKFLKEKAESNCYIDGVGFVQKDRKHVKYVPVQMTEYTVKDKRFLIEQHQKTKDVQPSGEVKLENLFQKSEEFSKESPQYKAAETKKAKEDCLNELSRVACVIAPAGMGKTCLTKQALKLVVNGKFKADYIFYLKFRDIDYESETNLLSLLTGEQHYEQFDQQRISKIVNTIAKNPKIFLVLDGIDESTLTFKNQTLLNIYGRAKAETYILGLLSGQIFPQAKILLTSRPFQLLNMPKEYRPYYIVQLNGISKSSQRQICKDICEASASVIFNHIQNYTKLSDYCDNPLICILIMYCLFKTYNENQNSNLPTTLTEIFFHLILLYIKDQTHVRGNINLKNLCTLAWNGISNRKFFFDNNDMELAGLQNIEKNDFTITIECKSSKNLLSLLTHDSTQFTYFTHLSIEEFFAAMHVVFFKENVKEFEKLFSHDHDLYLHETNYDMFALFIFGLCSESTFSQYFSHDFSVDFNLDFYNQKVMMTKQYLQTIQPTYDDFSRLTESSLKTMDWFYQFNDEGLTCQFADSINNSIDIDTNDITPNYILPFNYILRHRSKEIIFRDVDCYDGCERFVEELGRTLDENHNVKLGELRLYTKLTAENVSSFEICLRKVEEGIQFRRGFESLKAAKKFKNFIMERETPLEYLHCDNGQWYDFLIRSTIRRCQEKVKNQIDFDLYLID